MLAISFQAAAQGPAPDPAKDDRTARRAGVVDIPMLERSRIFRNVPNDKTEELYEGWLALHFSLGGSMQLSYDDAQMSGKPDWVLLPSFSMIVNLRQTEEDSAPVRTPSYMPRLRLTAVRTTAPSNQGSRQVVFDGTFGHYSNGQDGCLFEGQDPDRDCAFLRPVADEALRVNRRDGSFSSHYLEGGAAFRWLTWKNELLANTRVPSARVITAFVRARDHKVLSGLPGGMSDDLLRLYGSRRVRAGGEFLSEIRTTERWWGGPYWVNAWVEVSNGDAPQVRKWRTSAETGKTLDGLNGTGVFVRWYYGHDDYNIGFLQPLNVVQVGLTLGGERRPTYKQ